MTDNIVSDTINKDTGSDMLLEESEKFCKAMGLHENLIFEILETDSDWGFILKLDALLETASKEIIRHGLRLKKLNTTFDDFVDTLPMHGKTSLLKLLEAAGLPTEYRGFIEATRRIRNAYDQNINYANVNLIKLIEIQPDKSSLLKNLSPMEDYNESWLIASYEEDPEFLRYFIVDAATYVIFYARIKLRQKISRLVPYFIRANVMHSLTQKMRSAFFESTIEATKRGEPRTSDLWGEFHTYLYCWLSSLFVVAEGFQTLGLKTERLKENCQTLVITTDDCNRSNKIR